MCDGQKHNDVCTNPNCGQQYDRTRGRNGLCPRCTAYMRRHGELRPAVLRPPKRTCANPNCGRDISERSKRGSATLCSRCYRYLKDHGVNWTPELGHRSPHTTPPVCSQCKRRTARYMRPKPQCRLCFDHWKRTGKFRPKTLDAEKCKVCGRPRQFEPKEFIKGRCRSCYGYWWNHGKTKERPAHLWGSGRYGYCECRNPANHKVTIRIHGHLEEMPLCDECHAEHQRQVAWYGDGKPTGNLQEGKRIISGDD